MNNRFLIIVTLLVVGFFGFLVLARDDSNSSSSQNVEPTSHYTNGPDAPVVLTEYGDFECSACALYYPVLQQVKEKYGEQLSFQFRNFPLVSLHPNAMQAHRAAEAAAKQDKFFEMHDLLYENIQAWNGQATQNPTAIFEGFATQLALDMEQYRADVASNEVKSLIDADIAVGTDLSISSTPTFLINGEKVDSIDRTVEAFSALIDEALANNTSNE